MLKFYVSTNLNSGGTLNIEADNINELHGALTYMHSIGQIGGPVAAAEPVSDAPPAPVGDEPDDPVDAGAAAADASGTAPVVNTAPPAAEEAKPKRTRKPKEEKAEPVKADTAEKATSAEAGKAKKEDAAAAVTELANEKGLQAAKGVLEEFGVKRAGELDEEQYAPFVARVRELLKAGDDKGDEDDATGLL